MESDRYHTKLHLDQDIPLMDIDRLAQQITIAQAADGGTDTAEMAFIIRFRDLDEAKEIGTLLSVLYPQPQSALLGLMELLINAIEHGNLSIGYELKHQLLTSGRWLSEIKRRLALPENRDKYVEIFFKNSPTDIQITITDAGNGFDSLFYQNRIMSEIETLNGRGLILARTLAFDDMIHNSAGNAVTAITQLSI